MLVLVDASRTQGDAADDFLNAGPSAAIHGSLMVALDNSSAVVRARALEQLAKALSTAPGAEDGEAEGVCFA